MDEKYKNRLKRIGKFFVFKVPIIIVVLIVMMIVSLKLVERYPDPLRQGFEDYLSRTYGTTATIGQLESVKFFPNLQIKARDITMHNKSNAAVIDIAVGSVDIKAPFTAMIFGTGKIKNLEIHDLMASENFILPQALKIKSVSLIEKQGPEQYGAFLIAEGVYAKQSMTLEAELEKNGDLYKINKSIPFSLSVGSATLNAQLNKGRGGKVLLKNAVYSVGGDNSAAKDYGVLEKGVFQTENPLSCLVIQDSVNKCRDYLNN